MDTWFFIPPNFSQHHQINSQESSRWHVYASLKYAEIGFKTALQAYIWSFRYKLPGEHIALMAQMINKQFLRTSLIAVIIIFVCLCQHSVILEYFE